MSSSAKIAYEFLIDLTPIPEGSLAEGAECNICKVPFGTQPFEGCRLEHPTRLPCAGSHVFGSECIKDWLSPGRLSHNNCPYCRQELFPPCETLVAATELAEETDMGIADTTSDDTWLTSGSDMGADLYPGPDMSKFELEDGEIAPPDHPIRTLRQREVELYIELYNRLKRPQDSPASGEYLFLSEFFDDSRESYMFKQLIKIGAFDDEALPEHHGGFSKEGSSDDADTTANRELWKDLKREGLCWDLGPVAGQEGRKKGWYLD